MSNGVIAEQIKRRNIIDMALTFTAMIRVFEKKSKERITVKLNELSERLADITTKDQLERVHSEFCDWFVSEIITAEKILKNETRKEARPASYGHAAKVFDIVMKVYVYYSHLPSKSVADLLTPWLHAGLDTPMMEYLHRKYPSDAVSPQTIEQVNKEAYEMLQILVQRDISETFKGKILPVQFDDVMWYTLNRTN